LRVHSCSLLNALNPGDALGGAVVWLAQPASRARANAATIPAFMGTSIAPWMWQAARQGLADQAMRLISRTIHSMSDSVVWTLVMHARSTGSPPASRTADIHAICRS